MIPETPGDVSVGELYRLLVRLEKAVSELGLRLEGKMVTIDVYTIAQKQISDDTTEVKENLQRHLVEHELEERERKQVRTALTAAVITALVAFSVGVGSIVVSVVH